MPTIDWKTIVMRPEWIARLDAMAARRFGAGGLAEEATTYVIDQLSADHWSIFNSFAGHAKPETYLNTLAANFIEEFSRKRFGRPRPPSWLQSKGETWILVWRMLCLERQHPESIINVFIGRGVAKEAAVRDMLQTIKSRLPQCGEQVREIAHPAPDEDVGTQEQNVTAQQASTQPEQQLDDLYTEDLLQLMSFLIGDAAQAQQLLQQVKIPAYVATWKEKLDHFRNNIRLADEEIIILRMYYCDELNFNVIAQALGLQSHLPGRIAKRAIKKINEQLQSIGADLTALKELLR